MEARARIGTQCWQGLASVLAVWHSDALSPLVTEYQPPPRPGSQWFPEGAHSLWSSIQMPLKPDAEFSNASLDSLLHKAT